MIRTTDVAKVEYGDFQTPLKLAEQVCKKLVELGVEPDVIVEPTCGVGNFVEAAAHSFQAVDKIIGVEINPDYLQEFKKRQIAQEQRIEIRQGDFFKFNWSSLIDDSQKKVLVLGNFPWVTNSKQGAIGGINLPKKSNFQNHSGLNALTGKSNFDISEWMLIQAIEWLQYRESYLAMLCKTAVSRKILRHLHSNKLNLSYCATYQIDAKKHFNASVDACLLFCKFQPSYQNYYCNVFNTLESSKFERIGYQDNVLIKDIDSFRKLSQLYDRNNETKWRSGIKHDCANVMEFRRVGDLFVNGFNESVDLEETYLFPLLKGSDVAQNRLNAPDRYALVTQRWVGEPTEPIRNLAPKTWSYLEAHANYLDGRKSRIYQKNPRFSIFGVGSYTFTPWKIAISGLYKQLDFRLVNMADEKPIVFDDTIYFLSFDDKDSAYKVFELLTSSSVISFYSSLIFWDEKRPIKSSTLNALSLTALAGTNLFTASRSVQSETPQEPHSA